MKICFVGLGSIGRRHLENVQDYCLENNFELTVHACRSGQGVSGKVAGIEREFYSPTESDTWYDAILITNTTAAHFETLCDFSEKTKHFFIEKPIFDDPDLPIEEITFLDDSEVIVAAPLRFSPVFPELKRIVSGKKVLSVRSICSSYLPDWRPGVDYRSLYCANAVQGGGVSLDLIHEWDYLTVLFGFPRSVYQIKKKVSDLEISAEDIAVYIAEYKDKIVELHLDYFGRSPKREVAILMSDSSANVDFLKNEITFSNTDEIISYPEDRNQMYKRELHSFFDCVLGGRKHSHNNIDNALRVLRLAIGKQGKYYV